MGADGRIRIPLEPRVYGMLRMSKIRYGHSTYSDFLRNAIVAYYILAEVCNHDKYCVQRLVERYSRDVEKLTYPGVSTQ